MRQFLVLSGVMIATFGACGPGVAAGQPCSVTEVAPGVKMRADNCPNAVAKPVGVRRYTEPMALVPPVLPTPQPFSVLETRPWPRERGVGIRVR